MFIAFDTDKQKVRIQPANDIPYYIGISNADWTIQDVLDYVTEYGKWCAEWTTDVSIEDMLDIKVSDTVGMESLGQLQISV